MFSKIAVWLGLTLVLFTAFKQIEDRQTLHLVALGLVGAATFCLVLTSWIRKTVETAVRKGVKEALEDWTNNR
jgi:hypothetical protein